MRRCTFIILSTLGKAEKGEFSPIGCLLILGRFLNYIPKSLKYLAMYVPTFLHVKSNV
jgi:hypothetical protein